VSLFYRCTNSFFSTVKPKELSWSPLPQSKRQRAKPIRACNDDHHIAGAADFPHVKSERGSSMAETLRKPRQEFRNIGLGQILFVYRLPLAGRTSILHRVSGVLLFVFMPFLLYLFDQSLTSELSFEFFKGFLSNIVVKLITLVLAWAFLFHFCAGIRYLVMDTNHKAVTKQSGRSTAMVVLVVSLILTIAFALKLFGGF
jgi:succinate dehydrogenase / fumarate reductase cytochrome b subunit